MVYFSLPYFFEDYNFILFLQNYIEKNPDNLNFPCKIDSIYGNFSFSFWNGDVNNCLNQDNLVLFDEMVYFQNITRFPVYLDCSNQFLTPADLNNVYFNAVLKAFEGAGHFIKITHKEVYDYINANYIGYNYILSENYSIFERQNDVELFDLVNLIEFPSCVNKEKDFLLKYPNKNKVSLILGDGCKECDLFNIQQCRQKEHNMQAIFSRESIYSSCESGFCYNLLTTEFNELSSLGYSHFRIKSPLFTELKNYHKYLIKFLIKPEFQLDFLVEMENTLW